MVGRGGRDKLGLTDLIWFAVRSKFAECKLAYKLRKNHPTRRTNSGFLGDGGRDKLGSTDIVWFAVRYKFAVGKLA